MIKLRIIQNLKYSNVSIEVFFEIDSPWIPRISENIGWYGFVGGKIKLDSEKFDQQFLPKEK